MLAYHDHNYGVHVTSCARGVGAVAQAIDEKYGHEKYGRLDIVVNNCAA